MYLSILIVGALLTSPAFPSPTPQSNALLNTRNDIKSCDDTSEIYSGSYTDKEGTYVTSDTITHPYVFPKIRKCWYNYFIIASTPTFLSWQKSSSNFYCTGTSTCAVTALNGTQVCQSKSTAVSAQVGLDIEGFSVGSGVTITLDNQQCYTASNTDACTWNDDQCHCVWKQQQILQQVGYRKQRCNLGHGDETQCMADWELDTPTTLTNYGCGSSCEDTNPCRNTNGQPCS
jgi:hypothetical protein